jgi:hypothetical protein
MGVGPLQQNWLEVQQAAGVATPGLPGKSRQHFMGVVHVCCEQLTAAALLGKMAQKRVAPSSRSARERGIGVASTRPRSSSSIRAPLRQEFAFSLNRQLYNSLKVIPCRGVRSLGRLLKRGGSSTCASTLRRGWPRRNCHRLPETRSWNTSRKKPPAYMAAVGVNAVSSPRGFQSTNRGVCREAESTLPRSKRDRSLSQTKRTERTTAREQIETMVRGPF